jgi:hypothetical protein
VTYMRNLIGRSSLYTEKFHAEEEQLWRLVDIWSVGGGGGSVMWTYGKSLVFRTQIYERWITQVE